MKQNEETKLAGVDEFIKKVNDPQFQANYGGDVRAEMHKNLRYFDRPQFDPNDIKEIEKLANFIKTDTKIRNLDLSGTILAEGGFKLIAEALAENKNLLYVNLNGNKMGSEGM